jgi:prepilin-type N-terminal cleavage/methylation domain-containing protein
LLILLLFFRDEMDVETGIMKKSFSAQRQEGFTLVELLVVMVIFIVVIIIATDAFNKILVRSGMLSKSAESNIEGVAGLEMLRHDLTQAGFGLPWSFANSSPPSYLEADISQHGSAYNDSTSGIPRAVVAGNNLAVTGFMSGTDYLVLKGTPLAQSRVSQQWTYVNYSSVGSSRPRIWSSDNMVNDTDRVVVMRRTFTDSGYENQLVCDSADPTKFYTTYKSQGFGSAQQDFAPAVPSEAYYLYGVTTAPQDPRMPFNRTDFYIKRPANDLPSSCADNTGFLYKAALSHSDGLLTEIPILACVGDMQVVLGWDMDEDGVVDAYSDADGDTVNGGLAADVQTVIANASLTASDAATFRKRLKIIKVYLLVQDGMRDLNYTNQNPIVVGNQSLGETSLTRNWTVAAIDANNWTNYRWKVYRIVVSPKNINLN